ncbi:hypothetical protein ep3_0018 [Escherichia phage vB_EcoM-ep3]|uniref:DUF551 domain-containing protein n=1 Tax=Escherichia phage vB_EcoM-ep3 TaxID=1541883 RepID=A0A088FQU9_9CAUD|nr:hypothetical protein ep3_0018 [Escherichia phage vB_EcoM-ep3]AIM50548.1 hypothetical protein ep3_0018 [Escherichia phage vB_EcoM-ep3]
MKQVTIDNVRERIAELEMVNSHGELSLRGEFELACLRMLADSMGGVDDDVRNVVALLENNEWAEHCTKTELGQRLESEITRLVGDVQPVPVVSDADPSLNAMMRALDAFYADDYVPERAMLAAFRILLADVREKPAPVVTDDRLLENLETRIKSLEIGERKGALSTHQEISLKAYRLTVQCLRSSAISDETDNTAQQFESLAGINANKHHDQWVNCSERLPDRFRDVPVMLSDGSQRVGRINHKDTWLIASYHHTKHQYTGDVVMWFDTPNPTSE